MADGSDTGSGAGREPSAVKDPNGAEADGCRLDRHPRDTRTRPAAVAKTMQSKITLAGTRVPPITSTHHHRVRRDHRHLLASHSLSLACPRTQTRIPRRWPGTGQRPEPPTQAPPTQSVAARPLAAGPLVPTNVPTGPAIVTGAGA
jgi:hypothetical protein